MSSVSFCRKRRHKATKRGGGSWEHMNGLRLPAPPRPASVLGGVRHQEKNRRGGGAGWTTRGSGLEALPPTSTPGGAPFRTAFHPRLEPPGRVYEGGYQTIGEEVYTSNGKTENSL